MGLIDFIGKVAGHIQEVSERKIEGSEAYDEKVWNERRYLDDCTLAELIDISKNYNNASYRRIAARQLMKEKYNYEL